jgi:hypothetical protein
MSGVCFYPLRREHGFCLEAVEDGIDGAFGEDELGVLLEEADDFEAVEAAVPEGGERGHFDGTFAELGLPGSWADGESFRGRFLR